MTFDYSIYRANVRPAEGAPLREFYALQRLLHASEPFGRFYQAERASIPYHVEWCETPDMPSGVNAMIRQYSDAPNLVSIHLPRIPIPATDDNAEVVAHELTHAILFGEGFVSVGFTRAHSLIAPVLSDLCTHGHVLRRLIKYGFDVKRRYDAEMKANMKALKAYPNEPTASADRLKWALNFALRTIEYEAMTKRGSKHRFYGWFSGRYPGIAREAAQIVRIFHDHNDAATPQEQIACLRAIRGHYPLLHSTIFLHPLEAMPDHASLSYQPAIGLHDGTNWDAEASLTTNYSTGYYLVPGVYVSGKSANTAYTAAITGASGMTPAFQGYKTTNGGSSWAAFASPDVSGFALPGVLHIPWHNNPSDSIMYFASIQGAAPGTQILYRANGASKTDITPTFAGRPYIPRYNHGLHTCDSNRQLVVCCGTDDQTPTSADGAVFVSRDGGDNWTLVDGPVASGNRYLVGSIGGDGNSIYLLGIGKVGFSPDFGATIVSKVGNLNDFTTARITNLAGG